jgi:hypothetical protein
MAVGVVTSTLGAAANQPAGGSGSGQIGQMQVSYATRDQLQSAFISAAQLNSFVSLSTLTFGDYRMFGIYSGGERCAAQTLHPPAWQ